MSNPIPAPLAFWAGASIVTIGSVYLFNPTIALLVFGGVLTLYGVSQAILEALHTGIHVIARKNRDASS